MKKIISFIFIIILNLSCSLMESDIISLKVNTLIGDVKITSSKKIRPAKVGDVLNTNDIITTGEASFADILYGEEGFFRVYDNSQIKISSLMSNINNDTALELRKGKIFSVVDKLKKESNYKIKTSTTVVAVRGTSYRIEASEKNTTLEVVTGKVAVKPVIEGKPVDNAEKVVNEKEVLELDDKTAKEVSENKAELSVLKIEPETEKDILADLEDIDIEKIPALSGGVKKEFRNRIMKRRQVVGRSKNWWKKSQIRKQRMKKLRIKRRQLLRKRRLELRKLRETGNLDVEKLDKIDRKLDRIENRQKKIKEPSERIREKRKKLREKRKKRLQRLKKMGKKKRKEVEEMIE